MVDSKKTRKEPVEEIQASWWAQEQRIKENAIASSINAIAIADFAGNLTYVNNSFLKMWGYDDKNEVLGKPAVEFWKGKEKVLEIIEALCDGDSVITELVAKRKDGSLFDVLCSAGVVTDETGTPVCMLGSFMDITERKNTEEALRESEERYRAIFEQAADSIVLVDAETGELVEFNDRAHESLGYTREEFGGLKIEDFDVIESAKKVAKHIKKIVREGADTFETKHRTKGGEIRDILISCRAISIGGKDFIQSIWRDITEQKRAEEQIGSLARFPSENPYPVLRVAENWEILYSNNAGLRILSKWKSGVGKAVPERWQHLIAEVLKSGKSRIQEEVSGEIFSFVISPVIDAGYVNLYASDITERKNTEEALRESEERYRAIFEQAADSIVLIDAETGEFVEFNDRAHESLGYTREEFRGLKIEDFDVIESAEKAAKHIKKIVREGADTFETKHRTKSGEIRDILISCRAISIGGKDFTQSIWRDITEQKRAEKVLRFSLNFLERANLKTSKIPLLEEFVKEIQEFTECEAVGIRILDESGNIPYEAYAGFSKEFYELKNSLSVKSDKCMCINVIKEQTDSKLPFYTEGGSFYINGMARFLATVSEEDKSQNRHLCNEFGYESVALVPIRLRKALIGLIHVADSRKNMVPLYLVEMLEKITTQVTSAIQRVRAEEKLQEYTDQLEEKVKEQTRELCDRLKELNCLYSISNLLKNPNLSLHEIFQATVELIPVSWQYPAITCSRFTLKDEQFSTSNFRETPWKQTSDIILHGERIGSVEVCYLEEKPQRDEGPFSKEERNLINAVAEFLETITELKLMEQHERKHREEIAHFARLSTIGEMSSALAHELNQPLCAIAAYADGALRMMKSGDWDSNELLEAMEVAGTQAERAGKIIRRIANLVRKKAPHRSGVSIGEIIRETINLIEYEARLKGITIQWLEPSENFPMLKVDRIQIQQVLVNLLHNSFEAMKDVDQSKRQISIEVSIDENDMIQVMVSDTGRGLSAEGTNRIFEPFFTTNSQGLGMGLSISRSIIEAHGGRIWAESNPADGATFRFTLPM